MAKRSRRSNCNRVARAVECRWHKRRRPRATGLHTPPLMHRSPIPKLQGPPPEKRPKIFSRCARITDRASRAHYAHVSPPPRATRIGSSTVCCRGSGGRAPGLGKFWAFCALFAPEKRRLWAGTAKGHARRHRALRPLYRPPFVPLRLARIVLHELPSPDCSRESRQPEWQWQGQGAGREGGGQWKPGTGGGIGDAPCPALAPDLHHPPRCCGPVSGSEWVGLAGVGWGLVGGGRAAGSSWLGCTTP